MPIVIQPENESAVWTKVVYDLNYSIPLFLWNLYNCKINKNDCNLQWVRRLLHILSHQQRSSFWARFSAALLRHKTIRGDYRGNEQTERHSQKVLEDIASVLSLPLEHICADKQVQYACYRAGSFKWSHPLLFKVVINFTFVFALHIK